MQSASVLVIFIDGLIPGGLAAADTPVLDALMEDGAVSLVAQAESTTISGSGWSSFLNGVHWDKHRVPDNRFLAPDYASWPHLFTYLPDEVVTASCQSWEPIERGLVQPAGPDHSAFFDYYESAEDYWDDDSCDRSCTDWTVELLQTTDVDVAVVMYGELDGVAHKEGYGAQFESYQRMLARIDAQIGEILAAARSRGGEWTVVLSSDHGGDPEHHHGRNTPSHRTIPFVVSGPGVVAGEIWPAPRTVDVVPTVLELMGVDAVPGLDGRSVLRDRGPTPPQLGTNVLEATPGRGTEGLWGRPDVAVRGWQDPGELSMLSDGSLVGGAIPRDTSIQRTVDLGAIGAGGSLRYTLSARLGGKGGDASGLNLAFLDAEGGVVSVAGIGPRSGTPVPLQLAGTVPTDATAVQISLPMLYADGAFNDGSAADVSLIFEEVTVPATGSR